MIKNKVCQQKKKKKEKMSQDGKNVIICKANNNLESKEIHLNQQKNKIEKVKN